MKIGILGGTFNPPHIGHCILAQQVVSQVGLDKVFFIPTNLPPHKTNEHIEAKHRLIMTELTVKGNDKFEVLDLEIERGGVSYTVDTVSELKQKYPEDKFYLIVGSDLANDFSSWKDFDRLRTMVKIVVAQRKENPLAEKGDFIFANITQVDISSSLIREYIKKGYPVKYLVRDKVAEYIDNYNLYR